MAQFVNEECAYFKFENEMRYEHALDPDYESHY